MTKLSSLLYLSYPLVLHLSIYYSHLNWGLYWLALLLFGTAVHKFVIQGGLSGRSISLLVAALFLALTGFWFPELIAKLIPLLFNFLLFVLFARSLQAGKVALITQMACLLRKVEPVELDENVLNYTRLATKMWAAFFLLLTIVSAVLALFASMNWWSFFTNFLSYPLVGIMFVFEFWLRKLLIGKQMDYTMKEFFQRIRGVKLTQVLRLSK